MSEEPQNPPEQDPAAEDQTTPSKKRGGVGKKGRVRSWIVWAVISGLLGITAQYIESYDHRWIVPSLVFYFATALTAARALWIQLVNYGASYRQAKKWAAIVIIGGLGICVALAFFKSAPSTDESGNPLGLLLPANDPPTTMTRLVKKMGLNLSPNGPSFPTNGIFLVMGGNLVALGPTKSVPIVRFHDKTMIRLSIGAIGASVSGEFLDRNENAFAVIETNTFILNRPHYWRISRPDKSTLIVTSHQNEEVLNIRFCAKNFFEISGIFQFPDGTKAVVTKTNCVYRGNTIVDSVTKGEGGLGINSNGGFSWGATEQDRTK